MQSDSRGKSIAASAIRAIVQVRERLAIARTENQRVVKVDEAAIGQLKGELLVVGGRFGVGVVQCGGCALRLIAAVSCERVKVGRLTVGAQRESKRADWRVNAMRAEVRPSAQNSAAAAQLECAENALVCRIVVVARRAEVADDLHALATSSGGADRALPPLLLARWQIASWLAQCGATGEKRGGE